MGAAPDQRESLTQRIGRGLLLAGGTFLVLLAARILLLVLDLPQSRIGRWAMAISGYPIFHWVVAGAGLLGAMVGCKIHAAIARMLQILGCMIASSFVCWGITLAGGAAVVIVQRLAWLGAHTVPRSGSSWSRVFAWAQTGSEVGAVLGLAAGMWLLRATGDDARQTGPRSDGDDGEIRCE